MQLLEDQGKRLLRNHQIKIPYGRTVTSPDQITDIKWPMMVKALVPTGGRGKAGGVVKVSNLEEARSQAQRILGLSISGYPVHAVLVEEMVPVARELYLSISIDRSSGVPLLLASGTGGMDVESLPEGSVGRWPVHPFLGIRSYLIRDITRALGLKGRETELNDLLGRLWETFVSMDCELVEINPLALTERGDLEAVDAKITINDDARYRHPELSQLSEDHEGLEEEARNEGLAFVRLDGTIGVIANGAGLTMATLDELVLHGGKGGAFLDLGGTDDPAKVGRALEIMGRAGPRVVLLNVFGGITKCDTVAEGVIGALERPGVDFPIVARIRGVNEDRAKELLRSRGIAAHTDLEDAVKEAVRLEGRP